MKKTFLSLAFTCLAAITFGQSGLYVKAGLGSGISNASYRASDRTENEYGQTLRSDNAIAGIGFCKHNWQFETGIGYWSAGVRFNRSYTFEPAHIPASGILTPTPVTFSLKTRHIFIPAWAGYRIDVGKRLGLTPAIGIAATGNQPVDITTDINNDKTTSTMSGNSIGAIAMLRIEAGYRLSRHFSVWLSPQLQQTITPSSNAYSTFVSNIYDRAILLNVGISCHIPTAAKQKQP